MLMNTMSMEQFNLTCRIVEMSSWSVRRIAKRIAIVWNWRWSAWKQSNKIVVVVVVGGFCWCWQSHCFDAIHDVCFFFQFVRWFDVQTMLENLKIKQFYRLHNKTMIPNRMDDVSSFVRSNASRKWQLMDFLRIKTAPMVIVVTSWICVVCE